MFVFECLCWNSYVVNIVVVLIIYLILSYENYSKCKVLVGWWRGYVVDCKFVKIGLILVFVFNKINSLLDVLYYLDFFLKQVLKYLCFVFVLFCMVLGVLCMLCQFFLLNVFVVFFQYFSVGMVCDGFDYFVVVFGLIKFDGCVFLQVVGYIGVCVRMCYCVFNFVYFLCDCVIICRLFIVFVNDGQVFFFDICQESDQLIGQRDGKWFVVFVLGKVVFFVFDMVLVDFQCVVDVLVQFY